VKKILIAAAALAATATTMVAVPAVAAPQAQTVKVTEREYRIALSARPKAGMVTFVIKNAGDDAHDFWVKGGGKTAKSKVLGGGASARLTIKLKRGVRYQYWCAVDDHAVEGMRGSFVAR
jgi:uncharacterized cupredoxin-like copper-binding protein